VHHVEEGEEGAATWTRGGGRGSTPGSGAAPAKVVRQTVDDKGGGAAWYGCLLMDRPGNEGEWARPGIHSAIFDLFNFFKLI
jgi:hypothetical protein